MGSRMPDTPARRRLPRREMLVVGGGVLFISIVSHFRSPLLPDIGAELAMSTGALGLVTTMFAVGRLLTDVPAGRLVDRLGVRPMFVVAGATLAIGGSMFAGAPASWWILAGAAVLGVSSAIANTTGMTYFSSVASTETRGRSLSAFNAALLGGQALGPMVGGLIAGAATWRTAMLVSGISGAALAALAAAAGILGFRVLQRAGSGRSSEGPPSGPGQHHRAAEGRESLLPPLQRTVLYAVPFSTMFMNGSLPQTLVPIIGASTLGLTTASIGLALGLAGLCRIVGSPIGGWFSDRFARKVVLVPALLFQASGVTVLAFSRSVPHWLLAIVLMALFSFAGAVAATMLADLAGARNMGRRLGNFRFVGDSGLIIGPATTAFVFERAGQTPAVLIVAALLTTVAIAAAFVLPETRWLTAETSPPPGGPTGRPT